MGEAAKISLKAIGKQDNHLLSNDLEDSLFNFKWKRHSNFRKYLNVHKVSANSRITSWPFGEIIKVKLNPQNMGDLLTNIWINIELPKWTEEERKTWGWDFQYLGRKIIKSIKFRVDNIILEEITADWCIIHDNLYQSDDQKKSKNISLNRDSGYFFDDILRYNMGVRDNKLFIHIPFFFSQNNSSDGYKDNDQFKTPFPLCAIHKQKIELEIEFFKQSFFTVYDEPQEQEIRPIPPIKSLSDFKIITEEITLSNEEKLFFKKENLEIIYDFSIRHSSIQLETNKRIFNIKLEPQIPVKCFHWFFRYSGYEDEDEFRSIPRQTPSDLRFYYSKTFNRFNFSRQQYRRDSKLRNIFQYLKYHVLKSAYFSINDERIPNISNIEREYFFNYIHNQCKLSLPGVSPRDVPSPMGNLDFNYIYSYSFALYPKSNLPSGFIDFSTINSDKAVLHLELEDNLDIIHSLNPNEPPLTNPEYKFHMYYTGYKRLLFSNGFVSIA